jgi:hypothetical protein
MFLPGTLALDVSMTQAQHSETTMRAPSSLSPVLTHDDWKVCEYDTEEPTESSLDVDDLSLVNEYDVHQSMLNLVANHGRTFPAEVQLSPKVHRFDEELRDETVKKMGGGTVEMCKPELGITESLSGRNRQPSQQTILILHSSTSFSRDQMQNTSRAVSMLQARNILFSMLDASQAQNKDR